MLVLGIETSCDETAAAVVKDGRETLSNVVSSSLKEHSKYGGIVPEIACRAQIEVICAVVENALRKARVKSGDIGLIAVTYGPGLVGALLVGVSFAKGLSLSLGIPLVGVNHLHAHLYANFLKPGGLRFPYLGIVISGGHTSLVWAEDFLEYKPLGETIDDAVGEAFDKVAKILGLGYPGGPVIEKKAKQGKDKFNFPRSFSKGSLNFSFSGLKTAVLYHVRRNPSALSSPSALSDIAASFQSAAGDILIARTREAVRAKKAKRLVLGGGVSVNSFLRERFRELAREEKLELALPDAALCLDNGAMVAGLGFRLFQKGKVSGLDLTPNPDLRFSEI